MSSFCTHFDQGRCRSCRWIERPYGEQLQEKERATRMGLGLPASLILEPTVGSKLQGFRNRAKMSVTGTIEAPVIGIVGEGELDEGRDLLDCPIHHPRLNALLALMPDFIRENRLPPYRIAERKGELKGLIAFHSPVSDQTYLRFILRTREGIERIRGALPGLIKRFPSLVCASANLQPIPHAILEGPEEIILTDQTHIDHQLGALRLKLAPHAFVQTNVEVAETLYAEAARWIAEVQPERMLELYCGQGAFSFFAASGAKRILGIEINQDAVLMAQETEQDLGFSHLEFRQSDATKVEVEIRKFDPDLILANPPRKGLGAGTDLILDHGPRHLIYSSCSIESLAGDFQKLSSAYRIRRARIFDMFPHTAHFEILVLLERT